MSITKNNKSKILNLFEILASKEKLLLLFLFIISIGVIIIELITLTSIPILFSQLLDFRTDNKIIDSIIDKISIKSVNNFSFVMYGIIIIFFLGPYFYILLKFLNLLSIKELD